jgi:hypothetical protein
VLRVRRDVPAQKHEMKLAREVVGDAFDRGHANKGDALIRGHSPHARDDDLEHGAAVQSEQVDLINDDQAHLQSAATRIGD